ncbi:putative immunity protein [Kineococcus aurantiacus]|uniref:Imm-5-like domain-containing protein n=1 Tax=Kineococcus aurantiacus TaxID=37633 RepID=A0A7Y9DLI4_9ACTN|nr:hypothetical protein [Kineococcus aurantiacus]NYD22726.1 hypothetical protein [Kineococcus aurantiacus]
MILPAVRDPRLVTVRRGGTLTDEHHHLLARWAAACAEHVLPLFEAERPDDPRPRRAVEAARAWADGDLGMREARALGGHAMGAARPLRGAAHHAAHPGDPGAGRAERDWQRAQLPGAVRALVLEDQARRDAICFGAFAD